MEGMLYLVATPIGNMDDITIRALNILRDVDIIACEDTRHSQPLLNKYGIRKPLISYYKQKEQSESVNIINMLKEGKNIALITDAGMPCISDPGSILVKNARKENISITIVPGCSAVVSAFALSGITKSTGFTFLGFLPEQNKPKEEMLAMYSNLNTPLIFYMSPHNINKDCKFLFEHIGDRDIVVVKEITKIYETVIEDKLSTFNMENPRGEFVVIIKPKEIDNPLCKLDMVEHIKHYIECGMSKKDAIKQTAKDRHVNKNEAYKAAINL